MIKLKFTRGDFFGGVTAGIVALPLALAFGVQSGLGAESGLYGAIFLGFFASLLGGTHSQISGPTGPMTVVSSATIAGFVAGSGGLDNAFGAIIACFVLAGLIQILMGVLKIGSLIKYIPYPVISGFMSGIGVIIILLQLYPALGHSSPGGTVAVLTGFLPMIADINYWSLLLSSLTIAIIYLFPMITKAVPGTLVALIAVTVFSVLIEAPVSVIGDIPKGFPEMKIDSILNISPSLFSDILVAGITLAALGAIDSLLTSVVADNITKTKHQSNKELIGQGIGNSIGGLFGGLPGAGATMRTLVNVRSGGRNRISGVIHSLVLLAVLLGLGRYAELIPHPVLAGILITVGIGILDYKGLKHVAKIPRSDAVIMVLVLLFTVFLNLLSAVGIGMVLASLLFMKKMGDFNRDRTKVRDLNSYSRDANWPEEKIPQKLQDNVIIKHLEGPLFFGFASDFLRITNGLPTIKFVIIRMERVPFIDQTGLYALEESILSLERKGVNVLVTGLQKQPEYMLRRIQLIPGLITEDNLFKNFDDSINWLISNKKVE